VNSRGSTWNTEPCTDVGMLQLCKTFLTVRRRTNLVQSGPHVCCGNTAEQCSHLPKPQDCSGICWHVPPLGLEMGLLVSLPAVPAHRLRNSLTNTTRSTNVRRTATGSIGAAALTRERPSHPQFKWKRCEVK